MNKKILCIHHNDSDGKLAGAIVKNYMNIENHTCELIEVGYTNYKDKLKHLLVNETVPHYDMVFIVDFSLEKEEMETIKNNYYLVWCDHHKSAKEKLEEMWEDINQPGIRNLDRCGALLTYEYLYKTRTSTKEINLVDDYDRWQHKLGEKTHWFAELNKNWSIERWIELITNSDTNKMEPLLEKGKMLFELKKERIEKIISTGLPVTFRNKKTLFINNSNIYDGSLLGNMICNNGYDIALKYGFNKDKVIFGLNSIGELDVSIIAKEFGGGGHKNAAGFHIGIEYFNEFINKELK